MKVKAEHFKSFNSDSANKYYTVEEILDERINSQGEKECLIKWLGYDLKENSWLLEENIM